eukprot:2285878-Amphidinium_carterae.2
MHAQLVAGASVKYAQLVAGADVKHNPPKSYELSKRMLCPRSFFEFRAKQADSACGARIPISYTRGDLPLLRRAQLTCPKLSPPLLRISKRSTLQWAQHGT